MSDLRLVQFDVRDRHGEVVSIASDIYINIQLSANGKFEDNLPFKFHFVYVSCTQSNTVNSRTTDGFLSIYTQNVQKGRR